MLPQRSPLCAAPLLRGNGTDTSVPWPGAETPAPLAREKAETGRVRQAPTAVTPQIPGARTPRARNGMQPGQGAGALNLCIICGSGRGLLFPL